MRSIALELNTTASAVDALGNGALRLSLANGKHLEADIVLSAVGLRPAIALAQSAQLKTGRGIQIDRYGRTSDAHIFALGDCAEYGSEFGGDISAGSRATMSRRTAPARPAPCCPTSRRCWRRRAPSPPRWPARRRPSS